jgi:DNA-directed RNA polymerase specialized sigma24 family protein
LEEEDPRAAQVVMLRFFGGLSEDDTGRALGISPRTVRREWVYAKAWLYRALEAKD